MRMMLIEPSGSTSYASLGSPSLATSTYLPSGVKVTMSGSAPTCTTDRKFRWVSKNTTWPGACLLSFSTATATIPSRTATLLATAP